MRTRALTSPQQWRDRLRSHGLRVTGGRIAALGYIDAHPHSSVADIQAALSDEHPTLSLQSVYNIVTDLSECDILRRIDLPQSDSALYETQHRDNHHHVQCIGCGLVEDVECAIGAAPCLTPSHDHGIRILEAAVTFRGICAACERAERVAQAEQTAPAAPAGEAAVAAVLADPAQSLNPERPQAATRPDPALARATRPKTRYTSISPTPTKGPDL